jgi:hypothetical protein
MGMFGSLIRRKPALTLGEDNIAFESTTFSLSTAVPRPSDRRDEQRLPATLCIVKLTGERFEQLGRVRNLSAGGMMVEIGQSPDVGDKIEIEIQSQRVPSTVIWTRDGTAGLKFDQNVDLGELLAGRKPRHGFRPRPPRLEVNCKASLRIGKTYYNCEVTDISLAGMKIEPIEEYCLGKEVVVVVESLRPIKGEVRWFADRKAGVVFDKPLAFHELAEWIGKRLELASLKASIKNG